MTMEEFQLLSRQMEVQDTNESGANFVDSQGVVKNIDILTSDVVDEQSVESNEAAEEDCSIDSDSNPENDARRMFSNRSIKDLSLGNFQKFKILNQDS